MEKLTNLNDLIDSSRLNRGGVVNIYYADVDTIFDFPEFLLSDAVHGFVFDDQIDFLTGHGWHSVPILPHNKFGWQVDMVKTATGTKYKITIGGKLTQHTASITQQLHLMASKEFVLRVKDKDGKELVIGDLDTPLEFDWSFQSGDGITKEKVYIMKWTTETTTPPMGTPA